MRTVGRRRSGVGLALAILTVAGCSIDTSGVLSAEGCTDKATVDAELHVDTTDERYIWAIDRQTGGMISLRIPGGYGVQAAPDAIVDADGTVIGRTGDWLVSGCVDSIQNALMIDETDIRQAAPVS
jgi:hypothetical protein